MACTSFALSFCSSGLRLAVFLRRSASDHTGVSTSSFTVRSRSDRGGGRPCSRNLRGSRWYRTDRGSASACGDGCTRLKPQSQPPSSFHGDLSGEPPRSSDRQWLDWSAWGHLSLTCSLPHSVMCGRLHAGVVQAVILIPWSRGCNFTATMRFGRLKPACAAARRVRLLPTDYR